jgi:hypothetical protein
MPISVTNRIEDMGGARPSCDNLVNNMMAPEIVNAQLINRVNVLFAPGDATEVTIVLPDGAMNGNNGIGGARPQAGPQDGLGSAAESLSWRSGAHYIYLASIAMTFLL